MVEKRIDITERQDEYLERVLGDDGRSDPEMFRALFRKHRQIRRLLVLDEHDDVPDE